MTMNENKQAEPVAWAETDEHGEIAWGEEGCFSNDPAWIENPIPLYTHPVPAVAPQHPDDEAVDKFAAAMKQKLAQAREKGRSGWEQMNPADLSSMLREHVEKGDPRDVANFCMFLWSLGYAIEAVKPADADESMWCRYIASMIGEYLGEPLGSEKEKAIAGIIERRLWNLPKPAPAVAQEPVHFRAVLCREQQDQAIGVVPKVVGFVDKKAAEQFILEKRDFQGWRYNLEPLYTEAPAVAQEPLGWRVAFTKAPRGNFQEGQPDDSTREYWRKQGVGFEYCYAQPPAEVVRELVEALKDFSEYVRTEQFSTDGAVQYSNTQINRLVFKARSALKSAKEHGL